MRITKIVCDGCGKKIPGNPINVFAERVNIESGDFLDDESAYAPQRDFCEECMERIRDFIEGMCKKDVPAQEPAEEEQPTPVEENKPVVEEPRNETPGASEELPPPKKLTVKDLVLAGKSKEEVCRTTGCTPGTYYSTKYRIERERAATAGRKENDTPEQQPKTAEDIKPVKCSEMKGKCIFAAKIGGNIICDYLELTGKSRGCSAEACTKFKLKGGK